MRRTAAFPKQHPRAFVVVQLVVLGIFFGAAGSGSRPCGWPPTRRP
jgi:hypothetical protein